MRPFYLNVCFGLPAADRLAATDMRTRVRVPEPVGLAPRQREAFGERCDRILRARAGRAQLAHGRFERGGVRRFRRRPAFNHERELAARLLEVRQRVAYRAAPDLLVQLR